MSQNFFQDELKLQKNHPVPFSRLFQDKKGVKDNKNLSFFPQTKLVKNSILNKAICHIYSVIRHVWQVENGLDNTGLKPQKCLMRIKYSFNWCSMKIKQLIIWGHLE